jgi:3-oxoacyl-[acyl-carrier protein] reductase
VSQPLEGLIALVTGAHQGIGAACALALGEAGAEVVCVDLQNCEETAAFLTKSGRRAFSLMADISDESSVSELFDEIRAHARRLDVVVHCAGVIDERPLLEMIGVNLRGTFLVGREALRLMKNQGGEARVILVASDLAYYGRKSFSAYVASKHGVLGLTRCWARGFAPDIMINAICRVRSTPLCCAPRTSHPIGSRRSVTYRSAVWANPRTLAPWPHSWPGQAGASSPDRASGRMAAACRRRK